MGVVSGVNTVTDGLIFYVDPTNTNTYSGVGTTAYNLIPGGINNFSLNNGLSYDLDKSGSFYFDGSNDYVGLGSTTIFNSTAFTVSFWIKPTTYSGTYCSGAVSNGQYTIFGTSSTYQGYSSTFSGAIQTGGSSNAAATVNQSNFSINKWYHYVAVYDSAGTGNSTKFKIYIDGVIKSLTFDGTMPSSPYAAGQEARIGWGPGGGAYPYYNGNIGLVQIHRRALSSTEILQNYNATKARFDTTENIVTNGLILNVDPGKSASYPGTGTTINDLSGSGNTGTLVSSPTFSSLNSGSLVFNGSSYITRSSALNTGQNFSVTAWIYPTSLGSRNAVVGNGYPYTTDNGWLFCICENNFSLFQALFLSIGQNNVLVISNSYVFQLNKWSHIACSVSGGGSSVKFYVNGVETSYGFTSGSGRTISYATNEFHIGMRHSTTTERFAGNISQVQIYNTTLTATEIQQNYNATKARYINILPPVNDSLVLNLDAGNRASYAGTGTTWVDLSSNRISASLVDGVVFAGTGISTHFSFDGTGDYVNIPSTSLFNFGSGDFSVELAIYYNTSTSSDNTYRPAFMLGSGNSYLIMNKWRSGIGNGVVVDYSVTGSRYTITTTNSVPSPNVNNTITSPLFDVNAKWTHFVIRISSNVMTLYINSVSYGSVNLASRWNTNQGLTIGTGGGDYMSGLIPYFKFYNRALSASEILQNFNSVRSRYNI